MGKQKQQTLKTNELDATLILSTGSTSSQTAVESLLNNTIQTAEFADRYKKICRFAAGGVGVISKARDVVFDRVVALKELNPQQQSNPEAVQNFMNESRLNAQLDHPSIVPVYAMGKSHGGNWECAMKLINGTSLFQFIEKIREKYDTRKISPVQEHHALVTRLEYFIKICEAVEYCHSMNIVHGDIKPDNILMGKFGEVYLMDWGCAREMGTVAEHLSGTPNYMPPEFLKDKKVTPLVDIFALGMILFELTTLRPGRKVCSGGKTGDCTCALVFDLKNYTHYSPKLPIGNRLKAIISKAVHPNPEKRYQQVSELTAEVRHFIFDEEISALPDTPLQKIARTLYRNRVKTGFAVLTFFLLLCAGLFYSYHRSARMEQNNAEDLTRRLRLQSYTDILANAVEKKLLSAKNKLILFANNLTDCGNQKNWKNSGFRQTALFQTPEKIPDRLIRTPYYPNPVSLKFSSAEIPSGVSGTPRPDNTQYVDLCTRVLHCELNGRSATKLPKEPGRTLFDPSNSVQRFMVNWADGVKFSYPGSYDDPKTRAYALRWKRNPEKEEKNRKIKWSIPYQGLTGTWRIQCRHPLFQRPGDRWLGSADLEFRLEKLLAPLLRANSADPVHRLYLVSNDGNVCRIQNGKIIEISPKNSRYAELTGMLNSLKRNHLQQQIMEFLGERFYVSAAVIPSLDGCLLQMISVEDMKNHNHILVL